MHIYLIRHGETDWNRVRRLQGRENIPLNDHGREQANAAAEAFRGIPLDLIAVSPLDRAQNTAKIIAQYHPDTPMITDPDLIERDYGRLSGLTPDERAVFEASGQPDLAEPFETLYHRAYNTVRRYACRSDAHIALVSHGAWINSLIAYLTDFTSGSNKVWLKNCSITVLNEELHILHYNLAPEEFQNLSQ